MVRRVWHVPRSLQPLPTHYWYDITNLPLFLFGTHQSAPVSSSQHPQLLQQLRATNIPTKNNTTNKTITTTQPISVTPHNRQSAITVTTLTPQQQQCLVSALTPSWFSSVLSGFPVFLISSLTLRLGILGHVSSHLRSRQSLLGFTLPVLSVTDTLSVLLCVHVDLSSTFSCAHVSSRTNVLVQ
jgi:hypothetical protein